MGITYTLNLPIAGVGSSYDAEQKIISALNDLKDNVVVETNGYIPLVKGDDLACVGSITPTGQIFHGTGTGLLTTINVPYTGFTGNITIIPDGAFTWNEVGNIKTSGTAIVNKALTFTYTGLKWYPSY